MGQANSNKLYRTFVKGLITEASFLTYPEDSSLDELNTVPSRKGNRVRRLGLNYRLTDVSFNQARETDAYKEFLWRAVGGTPSLTLLAVQKGNLISFYDRATEDFNANGQGFAINLNSYTRPGVSDVRTTSCAFASGKGYLFVVSPDIEPLVVKYNKDNKTIDVTKIAILARDFEGLPDGLQNAEEPSVLSKEHFYNLMNQGWVSTSTQS